MRDPTNGELNIMLETLKTDMHENHEEFKVILEKLDGKLDKIEVQTTRTNGRVSSLEWWKAAIVWGVGVFIALLGITFATLRSIVMHEIERTVSVNLQKYDKIIIDNQ